jgi:hypothetical protein
MDAEVRRLREEEKVIRREERECLDALAAPVEELCKAAEVIARAALLASGYRRHNRGEWGRGVSSSAARKSLEAARPVGNPGPPDLATMSERELEERRATVAKLRNLADRAQDGDEKAVLEIRKILDSSQTLRGSSSRGQQSWRSRP